MRTLCLLEVANKAVRGDAVCQEAQSSANRVN